MLNHISDILARIMLGIFMTLLLLGVLLGTVGKPESPSYLVALFLAAGLFLLCLWFRPHCARLLSQHHRPGVFLAGLLLSLFCLGLNLLWVLRFQIEPSVDFLTFYDTACRLAAGEHVDWLYLGLFPHILGYSTFLSWFFRLFGSSPLVASLVNVGLTTLSGICLYLLCLRWIGYRAAVFGFFFWSVCPSKLLYNSMVMSEPLYTCCILLFLLLLSLALDEDFSFRIRGLLALPLGLLCGALLLSINAVRPVAMILLIAFFLWLLLLRGKALKDGKVWALLALFTAAMLLSCAKCNDYWQRWEYLHVYEPSSPLPAYNIYVGLNPDSLGSYSEEDMELLMKYRYDPENGSAVYAQEQMLMEAKKRLTSGEINFPKLFAVKLGKLIGNDEGGAFYAKEALSPGQFRFWALAGNVYYYFLVILCLLGAAALLRHPPRATVCMVPLYSIGLILAHLIIEVSGRYKYSLIPMLILIAGFSLDTLPVLKRHQPKSGVF